MATFAEAAASGGGGSSSTVSSLQMQLTSVNNQIAAEKQAIVTLQHEIGNANSQISDWSAKIQAIGSQVQQAQLKAADLAQLYAASAAGSPYSSNYNLLEGYAQKAKAAAGSYAGQTVYTSTNSQGQVTYSLTPISAQASSTPSAEQTVQPDQNVTYSPVSSLSNSQAESIINNYFSGSSTSASAGTSTTSGSSATAAYLSSLGQSFLNANSGNAGSTSVSDPYASLGL